jgi:N-acetylmuramoyl-L-alanine amidase
MDFPLDKKGRHGVFWASVALVCAVLSCLEADAHAGQSGKSDPAPPPADPAMVSVTKVRVGSHEGFTRIVLDLAAAQEWSVDQTPRAPIRVIIPGAQLDAAVRRLDFQNGVLRSIQPLNRSGGVEILLVCEPTPIKVRTLTLTDPDRLVVDVMRSGDREDVLAMAKGGPPSPATSNALGAARPRAPAPFAAKEETRPSPMGERAGRLAASPIPSGKDPSNEIVLPSEANRGADAPQLTVVLDPGHGGHDTGAIGPSGLLEKDVALDLALRLRRLLQERLGVRVLMTRTEDVFVSLPERSAFANRVKADFLVSLHVNAANKRGAIGFETFYFTREPSDNDARASAQRENLVIENNGAGKDLDALLRTTLADMAVTRDMKESSNLAEQILSSLEKILRVENRGVKSGPFSVLAAAAMPAVLVESAFITNPREERKLQRDDYRQRIAQAMFEGIAAYKVRYEQRLGLRNAPAAVGS